jgi:hypothetical protein
MPHDSQEWAILHHCIDVVIDNIRVIDCFGERTLAEVRQESQSGSKEFEDGVEEIGRIVAVDENEGHCKLEEVVGWHPDRGVLAEGGYQQYKGKYGDKVQKAIYSALVVRLAVDESGVHAKRRPCSGGDLAISASDGSRVGDLDFYLGIWVGVVVIEDERVESIALVDDGVVQILVGSCKQPWGGFLLELDNFVNLLADVDSLVELDLHSILHIRSKLRRGEGQWDGSAVSHWTAHAGLSSIHQFGDGVQGASGNADAVWAIESVGANQAVLGGDDAGLAGAAAG